jgi:hypothetical protein
MGVQSHRQKRQEKALLQLQAELRAELKNRSRRVREKEIPVEGYILSLFRCFLAVLPCADIR